jgi:pilus assembly protein FimV
LRAEIDLPQITPAEADTLRAKTATPEVFRAQGMEFNPAVNNLRVQLQRRADGTAVLRLSSDRPVNDPFIDLVLDATWSSGHIVRSYTMLFDPPALRRPRRKRVLHRFPRVRRRLPPRARPAALRSPAHAPLQPMALPFGRATRPVVWPTPTALPACRWTRCWWR